MAFPKLSRLVVCMCDMSMRDFVVESPFVSLLVRLCQRSLLFRLVNNINNVTNKSCPLCPASRGTEWLRFRNTASTLFACIQWALYNPAPLVLRKFCWIREGAGLKGKLKA